MNIANVLVRPLVTEKTMSQLQGEQTYVFEVALNANKIQIEKAIQEFYPEVHVEDVRTIVVRGKVKRQGRHAGKKRNWKKAYVRLSEGDTLDVFEV